MVTVHTKKHYSFTYLHCSCPMNSAPSTGPKKKKKKKAEMLDVIQTDT